MRGMSDGGGDVGVATGVGLRPPGVTAMGVWDVPVGVPMAWVYEGRWPVQKNAKVLICFVVSNNKY